MPALSDGHWRKGIYFSTVPQEDFRAVDRGGLRRNYGGRVSFEVSFEVGCEEAERERERIHSEVA